MGNTEIVENIKPAVGTDYLTCDSAEPKSISEIKALDVKARGAKKGPDSVRFGIKWLKEYRIIIDSKCEHTKNDFEGYHRKTSKATGEILETPADGNDDFIDALRYALENDMTGKKKAGFVKLKGR